MDDKGALGDEIKALKGLSITDLHTAYKQFCKNERVENSPVDLAEVIAFYNSALKDLPDAQKLKGMKLPGMSADPGRQGRALHRGVHAGEPAGMGADLRDSGKRAQRLHRRRRQALHAASRRRRARAGARLHRQSGAAGPAAGRLDHHPAARQDAAGRQRRHLRAQAARDHHRLEYRAHTEQDRDSRALSQLDLSRPRRLGRRDGGARLFRQIRKRADAGRKRDDRRVSPRDRAISIPTAISSAPAIASIMCSAACATRQCHLRRTGQGAAAADGRL